MSSGKHTATLAIREMDKTTENEARRLFFAYKEKGVITDGLFDDDVWTLSDDVYKYHLKFAFSEEAFEKLGKSIKMNVDGFKAYAKTYVMCRMGDYSLTTLRQLVHDIRKAASLDANELIKWLSGEEVGKATRLISFFSRLPSNGREGELDWLLEKLENAGEKGQSGEQRSLACFESYFRFDEIIKRFWRESTNEAERLFFFPVWMWWSVSGVLPLRPREFVLTPRKCLDDVNEKHYLTVRRNRIKGSGRAKSYKIDTDYETVRYQIPEKLADEIRWYIDATKGYADTMINTLFITETHYNMWERNVPYTSRYFTYMNLRTCLRYFFELIVSERYGYNVIRDNPFKTLQGELDIEYLHLGDTRHIALINLISEGATPVVAMLLAGHENVDMTAHYYSNITTLIECRTYRQYKKLTSGINNYALSSSRAKLKSKRFITLEDGSRCYSEKTSMRDFSDCYEALGPAGEVGFCASCNYHGDDSERFRDSKELYENRIRNEILSLEKIVRMVRGGKGDPEDITSALLRLRDSEYSYQQYLIEKLEEENVKEKVDRD